jgi:hypothetical protein
MSNEKEETRDVVSEGKVAVQVKDPEDLYNFRVQQDAIKAHSSHTMIIR